MEGGLCRGSLQLRRLGKDGMEKGMAVSGQWRVFLGRSWLKSSALQDPVEGQDGGLACVSQQHGGRGTDLEQSGPREGASLRVGAYISPGYYKTKTKNKSHAQCLGQHRFIP